MLADLLALGFGSGQGTVDGEMTVRFGAHDRVRRRVFALIAFPDPETRLRGEHLLSDCGWRVNRRRDVGAEAVVEVPRFWAWANRTYVLREGRVAVLRTPSKKAVRRLERRRQSRLQRPPIAIGILPKEEVDKAVRRAPKDQRETLSKRLLRQVTPASRVLTKWQDAELKRKRVLALAPDLAASFAHHAVLRTRKRLRQNHEAEAAEEEKWRQRHADLEKRLMPTLSSWLHALPLGLRGPRSDRHPYEETWAFVDLYPRLCELIRRARHEGTAVTTDELRREVRAAAESAPYLEGRIEPLIERLTDEGIERVRREGSRDDPNEPRHEALTIIATLLGIAFSTSTQLLKRYPAKPLTAPPSPTKQIPPM